MSTLLDSNVLIALAVHEHVHHDAATASPKVAMTGVIGHRQVTDAYLAQLARSREGRLATFDQGPAQLHADVAHLVPTG